LLLAVALSILVVASGQWTLAPAFVVFFLAWRFLTRNEEVPAAAAAFSYQWLQVTIAILYLAITGREISWMQWSRWQPMVLIGLAAICSLFFGYWLTAPRRLRPRAPSASFGAREPSLTQIVISYAIAVVISIAIKGFAWSFPGLTQVLLILTLARYALLFMLAYRLLSNRPHWLLLACLLVFELVLGFSGYFANFREPLAFVGLALVAMTRRRKSSVFALVLLVVLAFGAAVTWTAIKNAVRERYETSRSITDRLKVAVSMIKPSLSERRGGVTPQVEQLVSRMWTVYYPAKALERVPSIVPFEKGVLLWTAVRNVLNPRLFFPEKGMIGSDSDKVRKYTGIWVAGRDRGTSVAFGYAAEAYVDFGLPFMFVPILIFGALIGLADRFLHMMMRSNEVLQGVRVVFLWSSMYLFEISWTMMFGIAIGATVVLGIAGATYEIAMGLRSPASEPSRTRWLPAGLGPARRHASAINANSG
jgi:hypothetical protein